MVLSCIAVSGWVAGRFFRRLVRSWRASGPAWSVLAVVAFAGSLFPRMAIATPNYTVTWLGTLGGDTSGASAIDQGQVVGRSSAASGGVGEHAFLWTESGGMVDLGTLGGGDSVAYGVSNGQVVGTVFTVNSQRAFSWTQATGMVEISGPGCIGAFAFGVSDGTVAGTCNTNTGEHAVVWTSGGSMIDIGNLGGTHGAEAWGISKGLVVGNSSPADGTLCSHAFLWDGTGMLDLGPAVDCSYGLAVDNGMVVGNFSSLTGHDHPFLWTPGGGMVSFTSAEGVASGVSNGQVVGRIGDSAFSWTQAGGLVDLTPYVGAGGASGVNHGQIVGGGTHLGRAEAFLLIPSACGDGVTQSSEQCDDGNANNNDACKNDCTVAICSDGVIQTGVEECDDGNLISGDGCDAMCHTETIVQATAPPGGTVASATTIVTSPTGGAVKIVETSTVGTPPVGYGFVGKQVNLTAPPGTAAQPLVLTFHIAAADLPTGADHTNVQLTKNGAVVATCTGAPGVASPNPCVSARVGFPNGDAQITVLTATASVWVTNAPLCGCVTVTSPKLTLNKLNTLPGDDKLSFTGTFSLPAPITPALDPLTNGIRVLLQNAAAAVLDVTIPGGALVDPKGGAGWKVNTAGTIWTYTDKSPKPLAGIYQVVVQDQSKKSPGLVKLTVKGKKGIYGVAPETLPVSVHIALPPSDQQCAIATFAGPAPAPTCKFNKSRSTLTCR